MSSIPPKFFGVNSWILQLDSADGQAANSRLLVRWQKMHGTHRCYGELAELTVGDIWHQSPFCLDIPWKHRCWKRQPPADPAGSIY